MTACSPQDPNSPDVEALYPSGTAPEVRIARLSALCSVGDTPLILSGALRQILLQHFDDPANILNNTLRGYLTAQGVWKDAAPSGIYIEVVGRWKPTQMEQRPAIVLKENDWTWQKIAIGDQAAVNWQSGQIFYSGLWNGSHTLFALGHEGAETQLLATELARLLVYFGPVIRDQLALHRFQVVQIGALSQLKEATENYVVPVTVGYVREETWYLQPEAPRLKNIRFNLMQFDS